MPSLSEDGTTQDGSVCMPPTDQGMYTCITVNSFVLYVRVCVIKYM